MSALIVGVTALWKCSKRIDRLWRQRPCQQAIHAEHRHDGGKNEPVMLSHRDRKGVPIRMVKEQRRKADANVIKGSSFDHPGRKLRV